jgi:hypothetical protein
MAKTAAVTRATAAVGRDREVDFKGSGSSQFEMVLPMDEILPEKDAFAD